MGLFDRLKSSRPAESDAAESAVGPPASAEGTAESLAEAGAPEQTGEKKGFFSRFRKGLQKTARLLNTDIRDLFKQEGRLVDDDFLRELFAILIKTDIGANPAKEIREQIRTDFRGRVVHLSEVLDVVKQKIRSLLDQAETPIQFAAEGPTVIMVVGVNGSGKTTSIAKLASLLSGQGHSVLLGAGDTFRAAAVEQLTVWSQRLGCEIVTGDAKADPASVAHRAVSSALEKGTDVVIIDTAGRLQTQTSLMQELSKIRRVISKQIADAPHEVLLVLDATAGQNGLSQAKGFSEAAECTGIVLAKLDGSAKGGVVIPIKEQFALPVKYVGVGEAADDLALFVADDFVDALFDESTE